MTLENSPPPPPSTAVPEPAVVEEEQEQEEIKLSFVSLTADYQRLLINDSPTLAIPLPSYVRAKKYQERVEIVKNAILEACSVFHKNVDYVSEQNVARCAEEVVNVMYQRQRQARAAREEAKRKEEQEKEQRQRQQQPEEPKIELTEELTKEISWQEVSAVLSTSIKKDENPKLIDFCGKLLAQTHDDQLNIGFQAESSVGKSYIPLEIATYFPANEILKIASASPTAFYHSGVWDPDRKALIVDLRHKILIFLDMPHFQLLERLRPFLSHDEKELNYKITDKSQKYDSKPKTFL